MSDVIDLDSLVPEPRTVRIGGKDIQINPPSTATILRLGSLGNKMGEADKLTLEELEKVANDMTEVVKKIVPELAEVSLTTTQLMRLIQIINEMAVPTESKELEARGITPNTGDDQSPKATT